MQYKGYEAVIEQDENDRLFFGRVINIEDIIVFDGLSVDELEPAFKTVIEAPPVAASIEAVPVAPAVVQAAVSPVTSTAVVDSVALANAQREIEIRRCAAEANIAPAAVQAMVDSGKPFAEVALEIVKAHAGPLETVASKAGHPARIQVTRDAGGFIFDGFPRTAAQAEALDRFLGGKDMPVSLPLSSGITSPTALAAPVDEGMIF